MTPSVTLDLDDGLARVTLSRPERGNAIDRHLVDDLRAALERAGGARAILLRGAGRDFCVGGDLRAFDAAPDRGAFLRDLAGALHEAVELLVSFPAPVVVAVRGSAAGAGMSLAALGDIVVAAESASFVLAYTGVGLTPDGGSSWILPRVVGLRRAAELALLNRRLTAREALDWGLVTAVVGDAELDDRAAEVAARLVAGPTGALATTRRLLWAGAERPLAAHLREEADAIARAGDGHEGREGIAAFVERRRPRFAGIERS